MGYRENVLNELAEMALPENGILRAKIRKQGDASRLPAIHILPAAAGRQSIVSDDGQFAAFNTGLVTPRYDDFYACFEPNPMQAKANGGLLAFQNPEGAA
jgi:hypothetical protein